MGKWTYTYRDYDNEVSSVGVPVDDYTDLNIVAQQAAALALEVALGGVVLGNNTAISEESSRAVTGVGRAANPNAQRESKALVQYYDDTSFKRFTLEIPAPDLTRVNTDHPGVFYLKGAPNNNALWEVVVTQLEAALVVDGGTAIVEQIIHVGRNI